MSNRVNDGSDQPPAHEEVGYGKPPTCRQFKESGNFGGRPKGSRNRKTIVKEVANEMHRVTGNGKRRRQSTIDFVLLRLRNMVLEAQNVRAFDEFHRLIKVHQPQESNENVGYLVVPAEMTPEEWIAEQEELNKHRKPPPGYDG